MSGTEGFVDGGLWPVKSLGLGILFWVVVLVVVFFALFGLVNVAHGRYFWTKDGWEKFDGDSPLWYSGMGNAGNRHALSSQNETMVPGPSDRVAAWVPGMYNGLPRGWDSANDVVAQQTAGAAAPGVNSNVMTLSQATANYNAAQAAKAAPAQTVSSMDNKKGAFGLTGDATLNNALNSA